MMLEISFVRVKKGLRVFVSATGGRLNGLMAMEPQSLVITKVIDM